MPAPARVRDHVLGARRSPGRLGRAHIPQAGCAGAQAPRGNHDGHGDRGRMWAVHGIRRGGPEPARDGRRGRRAGIGSGRSVGWCVCGPARSRHRGRDRSAAVQARSGADARRRLYAVDRGRLSRGQGCSDPRPHQRPRRRRDHRGQRQPEGDPRGIGPAAGRRHLRDRRTLHRYGRRVDQPARAGEPQARQHTGTVGH